MGESKRQEGMHGKDFLFSEFPEIPEKSVGF